MTEYLMPFAAVVAAAAFALCCALSLRPRRGTAEWIRRAVLDRSFSSGWETEAPRSRDLLIMLLLTAVCAGLLLVTPLPRDYSSVDLLWSCLCIPLIFTSVWLLAGVPLPAVLACVMFMTRLIPPPEGAPALFLAGDRLYAVAVLCFVLFLTADTSVSRGRECAALVVCWALWGAACALEPGYVFHGALFLVISILAASFRRNGRAAAFIAMIAGAVIAAPAAALVFHTEHGLLSALGPFGAFDPAAIARDIGSAVTSAPVPVEINPVLLAVSAAALVVSAVRAVTKKSLRALICAAAALLEIAAAAAGGAYAPVFSVMTIAYISRRVWTDGTWYTKVLCVLAAVLSAAALAAWWLMPRTGGYVIRGIALPVF